MNIIITAPKKVDVSFATHNRIMDIYYRVSRGNTKVYTTYETNDSFENTLNRPASWLAREIYDGRIDMLIVVGYDRDMELIHAAERMGIDVTLFKET